MRLPHSGSFISVRSSRVNAVVVDACTFSPVPAVSWSMSSSRGNTTSFDRSTRSGRYPSSARRRSIRYSYSGESVPGW